VKRLAAISALLILAAPAPALAWGGTGHRIVGTVAMRALPSEVPAFLRTPQAAADIGELSRELDRSKGGGKLHDSSRDPAHFLDAEDDGRILGGPLVSTPPTTRADYEAALQAVGTNSWKAGYLNYAIVDETQQLARDFAYWRTLAAAERNPAWRAHRGWFVADRRRREALLLQTLGNLSHYVADGSQPLHVSAHYNGWGDYPNPQGFTQARIHGPFESDFVARVATPADVTRRLRPLRSCNCALEQRVADYLTGTWRQVEPFYALEKAGGFQGVDPRGKAFAEERLATGASELRDLIVEAWRASAEAEVGWKAVKVRDVEAGRVDPYLALVGAD